MSAADGGGPRLPSSRAFRFSRRLVDEASRIVPADRRSEWKSLGLGELWHRALELESDGRLGRREAFDLVRRSLGAFSHALFLASREWRVESFVRDLFYGLRSLRSRPGFAAVAVLTLALGIGANTFLFSVANGLLLHPFPYRDVGRLVAVETVFPRVSAEAEFVEALSLEDFQILSRESKTLTSLSAFDLGNRDLGGVGEPQRLLTAAF